MQYVVEVKRVVVFLFVVVVFVVFVFLFFFFSSRRRHTRLVRDWSSDVCSSDLTGNQVRMGRAELREQLSGKTRVRVGLLIDRLKREITLVLDGQVIQTYHDSNKDPLPVSRGLSFQSNNSYPLRISKITVSQWSGKLQLSSAIFFQRSIFPSVR